MLLDCEQILIFVNHMQTLNDAACIYVQCLANSPVKNTKLKGVFSVNETSHYNTSEFLKTYTSQAQIRRLDGQSGRGLPVPSSVQNQVDKTYARLWTDIIFVNHMQTLYDAACIHVQCLASSPVKNTKLNRVFSVNETSHYNTSEYS